MEFREAAKFPKKSSRIHSLGRARWLEADGGRALLHALREALGTLGIEASEFWRNSARLQKLQRNAYDGLEHDVPGDSLHRFGPRRRGSHLLPRPQACEVCGSWGGQREPAGRTSVEPGQVG